MDPRNDRPWGMVALGGVLALVLFVYPLLLGTPLLDPDEGLHAAIAQEIERLKIAYPIDRKAAREIIVARLNHLSEKHDLPYNKVFVKNQKTRWGSCSMKNNINLNINLARIPRELMDYAILHELVHTRVKDHSCRFWHMLLRHLPNARELDQELDKYWSLLGEDYCV